MGCSGSRPSTDLSAYGVAVGVNGSGASAPRAQFANGHANDFCNGITAGNAPGQWISCGEDKKVIVADWHAQRVVTTWCGHDKGVNRVIAAPHVGGALSASRDTTVKLWKANEDTAALTLKKHELSVQAIGLADDGSKALSGSRDYSLCLWDLAAGALVNTVSISRNVVTCLRWVPGEPHLVVQGSEDLRLRLWDVRTLSKPAATIEGKFTYFPLCVDSDGPYVATGSNGFDGVGCEVRVWDRRTMTQLHELRGHEQGVTGVAFLRGSGGGSDTLPTPRGLGCKDGTVRVGTPTPARAPLRATLATARASPALRRHGRTRRSRACGSTRAAQKAMSTPWRLRVKGFMWWRRAHRLSESTIIHPGITDSIACAIVL